MGTGQSLQATELNWFMCDAAACSLLLHASGNQNFECFALLAPMAPASTMLSRFLCLGSIVPVYQCTHGDTSCVLDQLST